MKKNLCRILLVALICCSAVFMFAGCEGDPLSNVKTSVDGTLTFNVQEYNNVYNLSKKEQIKLANNLSAITLKIDSGGTFKTYGGGSDTQINLATALDSEDPVCHFQGLGDLTKAGEGNLIVTFDGYTFYVPYTVGGGLAD